MKKVLMIRSNPVDPDPRVEKSANSLINAGYTVEIIAWDRSDNYAVKENCLELSNGTVKVHRVGYKGEFSGGMKKNLASLSKFLLFVRKWIRAHKNEYDIIHAYDFDTGLVAQHYAKKYNIKLVYDIADYYIASHALTGSTLGKIIKKQEDRVITEADATIICNEKRKEQIKDAKPAKLCVIHNTPADSLDLVNNTATADNGKLKLVYVGILGTARMIDVITEVVRSRTDCEFHIGGFGCGMEGYFEEASRLYDNIHYYGKLQYNQTLELELQCDVLCALYNPVVPNHQYAAPNKFYEALMLGKPLIMAQNTGMDEIVTQNDIGVVIEYSKEGLQNGIDTLLRRKSDWPEMGKRARKLYEEEYSWAIMEKRLLDLYEDLA